MANNRDNPPMRVRHADLEKFSDSPFKVCCPVCKEGIMLVRRVDELLSNVDHCVLCGQVFIYLDDSIAGKVLVMAAPRESPFATDSNKVSFTVPAAGIYDIQGPGVQPGVRRLAAGDMIEFDLTETLPARKVEP